jgi:fructokinase
MTPYKIGIDLGGTKIESILVDVQGNVCHKKRVPTPRGGDNEYEDIKDAVYFSIKETLQHVPDSHASTIGVGIPGTINREKQVVQNANTTSLSGRPFQKDLEVMLQRPIGMENDANCFTLAEALQGAAKGYDLVFGMILGSGCGGGICINGEIHQGRHLIAGEWGHYSIDPDGEKCWCGNSGCVETKISGTGASNRYLSNYGEKLPFEEIVKRYRNGDAGCSDVFHQFLEDFGRAVGGLISMLDPDAIVIGGGLSHVDEIYSLGVERVRHYAFHEHVQTPILKNRLGDSAGVYGAAWIGR